MTQASLFSGDHIPLQLAERRLREGDAPGALQALADKPGSSLAAVRAVLEALDRATGGDWLRGLPDPRAWHRAWLEALRAPEARGAERTWPGEQWTRPYLDGALRRAENQHVGRFRGVPTAGLALLLGHGPRAHHLAMEAATAATSTPDLVDLAHVSELAQPDADGRVLWLAALLRDPPADPRRPRPVLDPSGHAVLDPSFEWRGSFPLDVLARIGDLDLPGIEAGWIPAAALLDKLIAERHLLDPALRRIAGFDPEKPLDGEAPHRAFVLGLLGGRFADPTTRRTLKGLCPALFDRALASLR